MTIQGAIYELNNMLSSNDIPCYWKPVIKKIIETVEQTDGDLISKSVLDQIRWERDVAIDQLKDLGYELGEKPRTDGDLISRQAVINKIANTNFFLSNENWNELIKAIKDVPSEENTAEWIDREIYDADRWKCSKCGKTEQYREKYCPNCGCRMKGVE